MFIEAYKRAFSVITKKPFRLWGLSLLAGVISIFAGILTAPFLTIVGVSFIMVVNAGMAKVYLDALDGKEVNSDQLFVGFKRFWTVLGGMAWKALWTFIWCAIAIAAGVVVIAIFAAIGLSFGYQAMGIFTVIGAVLGYLVMLAGFVFVLYKTYSYSFVEYILMTDETVSATEALRQSVKLTRGKVLHIFLADFLFGLAAGLLTGILAALAFIPYVGFIFGIVLIVAVIVLALFSGIFQGLYMASFYKMPPVPEKPKYQAPQQPYGQPYQQPYGQPYQQPYGQPYQQPYQAPQQPYQAPQQPYQAPQQPYQAPQQPYQAPQQPYQAPQQPYQAPQDPNFPQQ